MHWIKKKEKKMNDFIFIFNYKPRSILFDMNIIYNYIDLQISKKNKVMLSNYIKKYENNANVLFLDKHFDIHATPDCLNLKYTWDIICYCKKIVILPSGGTCKIQIPISLV